MPDAILAPWEIFDETSTFIFTVHTIAFNMKSNVGDTLGTRKNTLAHLCSGSEASRTRS